MFMHTIIFIIKINKFNIEQKCQSLHVIVVVRIFFFWPLAKLKGKFSGCFPIHLATLIGYKVGNLCR